MTLVSYDNVSLSFALLIHIIKNMIFLFSSRVHTLIGHKAEISSAQFNWDCSYIATGSMDKTCKMWDAVTGTIIHEDI